MHIRERLKRGSTMDDSHLFYFNRRSLTYMLIHEGFRVLQVHEGLRPYRWLGDLTRKLPISLVAAGIRLLSLCQLKTGLSVIAAWPEARP